MQTYKAELFKALAHPVRIRILELLRGSDLTVSELQTALASEGSAVSQQLAVLRARNLVAGDREGTNVRYRAVDPKVYDLLDDARSMFETHLATLQEMAVDSR